MTSPNLQNSAWITLTLPFCDNQSIPHVKAISINANQFLISSADQLAMYNAQQDTITEVTANQVDCSKLLPVAVNKSNKEIYFCDYNKIHVFNVDTNLGREVEIKGREVEIKGRVVEIKALPTYFLFINDYFYMLYSNTGNDWIGSIENDTLNCTTSSLSPERPRKLYSASLIYIPSKQCLLLIGGYGFTIGTELSKDLWKYSLLTQKWIKMENICFERYTFGAVLTSNERYVILCGGLNDTEYPSNPVSDIWVLDMKDDNNWKIGRSIIKCPDVGHCSIVRTGGVDSKSDILVSGFVKECFKEKEFKHLTLPPIYIMMLINKWYNAEMIHWLKGNFSENFQV